MFKCLECGNTGEMLECPICDTPVRARRETVKIPPQPMAGLVWGDDDRLHDDRDFLDDLKWDRESRR